MRRYLRSLTTRKSGVQMARLGTIGVLNTIAYFVLFNLARVVVEMPRTASITVAFGLATLMSYVLNRRWTFELSRNAGGMRETTVFFAVNILAWAVTVGVVNLADHWFGPLTVIGENVASLVAAVFILVPKFASYRDIVFRRSLASRPGAFDDSLEVVADLPHPGESPGDAT